MLRRFGSTLFSVLAMTPHPVAQKIEFGRAARQATTTSAALRCEEEDVPSLATSTTTGTPDVAKQKTKLSWRGQQPSSANVEKEEGRRSLKEELEKETPIDSQLPIIDAALQGKNLFLTGSAGTGKSYLTRAIVRRLRHQGKRVGVVASTGVAACNIGGVTLHSFCRLSPKGGPAVSGKLASIMTWLDSFAFQKKAVSPKAKEAAEELMKGPLKALSQRTKNLDTLVIDEVSMLSAEVLEAAEITLRFAMWFHRSKSTTEHYTELPPFGGLQIIVVGDFLQLPPVSGKFCFKSPLWKRLQFENWNLQTPFRQNEPEFLQLLESIRLNRVTKAEVAELTKLCETSSDAEEEGKDRHVVLRCTNVDVDRINASKLSELPTQKVFVAEDKNAKQAETVLNIALHKELTLAVGARVVLTRNLSVESGLVNGATGTIVAFNEGSSKKDEAGYPLVQFDKRFDVEFVNDGHLPVLIQPCEFIIKDPVTQKRIASRQQLPLRLAWALTVHRSQGMSIPFVDVDLTDAFAKGQGYVGISRAMSIRGLKLRGGHALIDAAHPSALRFYESTSFMPQQQQQKADTEAAAMPSAPSAVPSDKHHAAAAVNQPLCATTEPKPIVRPGYGFVRT